jgi:hypothetical protein
MNVKFFNELAHAKQLLIYFYVRFADLSIPTNFLHTASSYKEVQKGVGYSDWVQMFQGLFFVNFYFSLLVMFVYCIHRHYKAHNRNLMPTT